MKLVPLLTSKKALNYDALFTYGFMFTKGTPKEKLEVLACYLAHKPLGECNFVQRDSHSFRHVWRFLVKFSFTNPAEDTELFLCNEDQLREGFL